MNTFYLKLLTSQFCINTQFVKLPYEIIEYILQYFIMIPTQKKFILSSSSNIHIEGIFSRINYIWKTYFSLRFKLYCYDISNDFYYNYKYMLLFYIKDIEYILNVLNSHKCFTNHIKYLPQNLCDYYNFLSFDLDYNRPETICKCTIISRNLYYIFNY